MPGGQRTLASASLMNQPFSYGPELSREMMLALSKDYDPTEWENVVRGMLDQAIEKYGEENALWWRDKDRGRRDYQRMPGKLDFEYSRHYFSTRDFPPHLVKTMAPSKRNAIMNVFTTPYGRAYGWSHTLDIECKTRGAEPNNAQWRALWMSEYNPGRHPVVVYPSHEPLLRRMLGLE